MKIPGINALRLAKKKYALGNVYMQDKFHLHARKKFDEEIKKSPSRTEIINFVLSKTAKDPVYLEIGVQNPADNFDKINCKEKYSVDPGYENKDNAVDFRMTSDEFFAAVRKGQILDKNIRFDLIFIDGSHLAEQVSKDIDNALQYLKEDGTIIMHDCNPPTAFHASEYYDYVLSPARTLWNGTTWKAFFKARKRKDIYSCCIDTDWGVGIISKKHNLGPASQVDNEFFEYKKFDENRKESLNLMTFEEFKQKYV